MFVEVGIFGGDRRLEQVRRDFVQRHTAAEARGWIVGRQGGVQQNAIAVEDTRGSGLVDALSQLAGRRQAARDGHVAGGGHCQTDQQHHQEHQNAGEDAIERAAVRRDLAV